MLIPPAGFSKMIFLLPLLAGYFLLQGLYFILIRTLQRRDGTAHPTSGYALGPTDASTAILLVHGFSDSPLTWQREARALAELGYYVCVPEVSHDLTESAWHADLLTRLQQLKSRHKHIILWGHSMGGALVTRLATQIEVDALVLWAPFFAPRMGRRSARFLYLLHRLAFRYPHTPTFFPTERTVHGDEALSYRVRRIIPIKTFAATLRTQYLAQQALPSCPIILLLSQRDTVVDNTATLKSLPNATILWAHNPHSSHALPNAVDWRENLSATLAALPKF